MTDISTLITYMMVAKNGLQMEHAIQALLGEEVIK